MNPEATGLVSALADRYRIERELGQGGMATVYLAQDLKHDRKVAIKVLRPELAAVIGAERFLREIKTIANLQHPHILGLIDSGEVRGTAYYVMPFVEGESLRDRLTREKQLPIPDALRLTTEVAGALDYAHRHGVIHRDIKPENILLHDGSALVADFGIALAVSSAGGSRMTETGMSLGTPHYMSPEQAMGEREITARADVYALGCVLYEMLSGDPPFTGSTAQAIVARVMTESPRPLTVQRHTIPAQVEAAVFTALEKLPADRFGSAADFAAALGGPAEGRPGGPGTARTSAGPPVRRSTPPPVATLATLAALATLALWGWLRPSAEAPTSRQEIVLWKRRLPSPLDPGTPLMASQAAIAPDGSSIVYVDSTVQGLMLMKKPRDGTAAPMAGTEGGVSPFFSPDGRWVGYLTLDGRLRKVPVEGGGSVTLAEDAHQEYKLGAWLDDGSIIYTTAASQIARVSGDGGEATVLMTALGANWDIPAMAPLPGSRGVLLTDCGGNCGITSTVYVYDASADTARVLVRQAAGAWYSPTGHLLYTSRDGGLYAAPFDLKRLRLTGGAVPVLEAVDPTRFTLSPSGDILYAVDLSALQPSTLVWVDRNGRSEPVDTAWRGQFDYPAISPDGRSLAVSVRGKTTDLWIRRADGTRDKVIADGVANWRPSWTPDGTSIAFISVRSSPTGTGNHASALLARVDGVGGTRPLHPYADDVWEAELSRDGAWLVIRIDNAQSDPNILARRLTGDTTLLPLLTDPSYSVQAALSPDSRWLAYVSNEAGRQFEVYVASFPDMESKRLVSRGGGTQPRWARSGRELYYRSGEQLMAVAVPPGATFMPGPAHALFSLSGYRVARNRQQYDVAPGDQRFLMIREPVTTGGTVYVEHWFPELLARMKH